MDRWPATRPVSAGCSCNARHRALLALLLCSLAVASGCAFHPPAHTRAESWAIADPDASTLLARTRNMVERMGGLSGFRILPNGPDAFAMRALSAMRAEQTLDIQYYLVHDGITTRVLMQQIIEAAERGVRVRILLDDTTTHGNDFRTAVLSAHPNVEVRLFNPLPAGRDNPVSRSVMFLTQLNRLHRRMHNKLWIADGAVAVIGGRNLGDEYFGASDDMNFADVDAVLVGPVVDELGMSFDEYWNSPNAVPVEAFMKRKPGRRDVDRLRGKIQRQIEGRKAASSPYLERLAQRIDDGSLDVDSQNLRWGHAHAIWDDPAKVDDTEALSPGRRLSAGLAPHLGGVERRFTLASPYFVPGEDGLAYFSGLAARGIDVRILTNSLKSTDVPFVHGAYARYRAPLLQAGVALHEMRALLPEEGGFARRLGFRGSSGASLHTKAMIIDDDLLFIGSYNFDPRSTYWNTEVGVFLRSPEIVADMGAMLADAFDPSHSFRLALQEGRVVYQGTKKDGRPVTVRRTTGNLWRHVQSWLSARFAPETLF